MLHDAVSSTWPSVDAMRRDLPGHAALARETAPVRCRGCAWYHGWWTTWRALQLASGADLHRDRFRDALPALPASPRVLISATADHALLAVTLDVLGDRAHTSRIHVLDRCETPLVLCDAFARERGVQLELHASDLLAFTHETRFDLVVVHALLGFFAPEQRPELFARWHDLLAPGGHLVLVQRVRPGPAPGARRSPPWRAPRASTRGESAPTR
jgi:hypothetical protein